jgi:polygalacturonase
MANTLACCSLAAFGAVVDWERAGAIAESRSAAQNNTRILNSVLRSLHPGDTLTISNSTFWVAGGVRAVHVHGVELRLDGTLRFLPGRNGWPTTHKCNWNPLQPTHVKTCVQEAFFIANSSSIRLTSSQVGTMDGSGSSWWGFINYAIHGENRPRLLSIYNTTDILVEKWRFEQSAYWTFTALDVARLEISHCAIDNRVNDHDEHGLLNLQALNTDGFDVAGRDIYIHDSTVWNQDDCFTIQPMDAAGHNARCTENVLIERVNASGLGLTVGAVRPTPHHNCVRNVTFRHARMHHTYKGIYIKSQHSTEANASAEITNILYENIVMEQPEQVPVWIGPAQEADSSGACSLLWPELPFARCPPPDESVLWTNITLRNVTIRSPKQSPGVILGSEKQPMRGLVFENVLVDDPGQWPWGKEYWWCQGVDMGVANGSTWPRPPCFA